MSNLNLKLKPCPFCGNEACCYGPDGFDSYFVECVMCGGEVSSFPSRQQAVLAWNIRPEDKKND